MTGSAGSPRSVSRANPLTPLLVGRGHRLARRRGGCGRTRWTSGRGPRRARRGHRTAGPARTRLPCDRGPSRRAAAHTIPRVRIGPFETIGLHRQAGVRALVASSGARSSAPTRSALRVTTAPATSGSPCTRSVAYYRRAGSARSCPSTCSSATARACATPARDQQDRDLRAHHRHLDRGHPARWLDPGRGRRLLGATRRTGAPGQPRRHPDRDLRPSHRHFQRGPAKRSSSSERAGCCCPTRP